MNNLLCLGNSSSLYYKGKYSRNIISNPCCFVYFSTGSPVISLIYSFTPILQVMPDWKGIKNFEIRLYTYVQETTLQLKLTMLNKCPELSIHDHECNHFNKFVSCAFHRPILVLNRQTKLQSIAQRISMNTDRHKHNNLGNINFHDHYNSKWNNTLPIQVYLRMECPKCNWTVYTTLHIKMKKFSQMGLFCSTKFHKILPLFLVSLLLSFSKSGILFLKNK